MAAHLARRLAQALRDLVRQRAIDRDLDDELRFHLEQMTDAEAARGIGPDDADRAARRRFGGMTQVKEACRDVRPLRALEELLQDLRFGARLLARGPLFTTVAVLSLALGIGANTAIFSLLNAVVLRTLPVPDAGQLRLATSVYQADVSPRFSYPLVEQARDALVGRAEVCGLSGVSTMRVARDGGEPEEAAVQLVSSDCFTLLRQRPQLGRLLDRRDASPGASPAVAVISDSFWSRRFGRSPAAVGSALRVNGTAVDIVGIAAPGFVGATVGSRVADLWTPAALQDAIRYSGSFSTTNGDADKPWPLQSRIRWLGILLRVTDGQDAAVAESLDRLAQAEYAGYGDDADARTRERFRSTRIVLTPGARGVSDLRGKLTTPLVVLLAMVGVLLAVACANLASLLLARASHRSREMAIRLSIGAGRGRLVRQLVTESLLLALLGGSVGVLFAYWGSSGLARAANRGSLPGVDVHPDWRVLAFALALSILTGLVFGLVPALRAAGARPADALKAQGRGAAGDPNPRTSRLLIAGQMACALVLLTAAALFVRSLQALLRVDVGYDRQHLLVATIDPHAAGYPVADLPGLEHRLIDRLSALPGVTSVSLSANGPFSGSQWTSTMEVEGYTHAGDEQIRTGEEVVTPGYFETVGLAIVRGRAFGPEDAAGRRKVTVINETLARRYFAGRDPIGRRWSYDSAFGEDTFEIVGVVRDAHYNDVRAQRLNMTYRPAAQTDDYLSSLEIRTSGDPAALIPEVREALRHAEPRLPVGRLDPLDVRVARSVGQERLLAWATGVFGVTALALACLGLYGTISYSVTRRTTELGVRMALGADRSAVRRLILMEASRVVGTGLAVGFPLTLLIASTLRGVVAGVPTADPLSYAAAVVALIVVAALAAALPARRAARLDPIQALRAD